MLGWENGFKFVAYGCVVGRATNNGKEDCGLADYGLAHFD